MSCGHLPTCIACSAVTGSAALDVMERILSSLVAMDGVPPADWSGILSLLYHKGMDIRVCHRKLGLCQVINYMVVFAILHGAANEIVSP